MYEHLLWESQADVVVELGAQSGGSVLWFRDRFRTMEHYGHIGRGRVISIDVDIMPARETLSTADPQNAERITLVQGDVRDPELAEHIAELVPGGPRCLVRRGFRPRL